LTSDDAERALLAERMLSEQEERRRVAELIHDGPVQQLSAIAQMLDAGLSDLDRGEAGQAREVFARGLEIAREAARDLRQLCDDLEPRVLHQLGFASAAAQASLVIIGAFADAQNRGNSFRLVETAHCDPNLCDDPNNEPAGKRSRMLNSHSRCSVQ